MAAPSKRDAYAPEAVAVSDLPEVVAAHNGLSRNGSLRRPEVYDSPNDKYPVEGQVTYDGQFYAPDNKNEDVPFKSDQSQPRRRQICGLRPALFIGLCILAVLVVLAAILGGVLGALLPHSGNNGNSSNARPSTNSTQNAQSIPLSDNSQLALLYPSGGNALHAYFSRSNGTIAGATYANETWKQTGYTPPCLNVASNARSGTPLSAISYNNNGVVQRQIFYVDTNNNINTVTSHGPANWQQPIIVTVDNKTATTSPGNQLLVACVGQTSDALNGIRLFYGDETGAIRVAQLDWPQPSGNISTTSSYRLDQLVDGIDVTAGAGCTYGNDDHLRLYYRANGTGSMFQGTMDFRNGSYDDEFEWVNIAPANELPAKGSALSVTTDGVIDYFVYEDSNSNIVKTSAVHNYNITSVQTNQQSLNLAPGGHGLATLYTSDGWLVMNQNKSAPSDLEHMVFSSF